MITIYELQGVNELFTQQFKTKKEAINFIGKAAELFPDKVFIAKEGRCNHYFFKTIK